MTIRDINPNDYYFTKFHEIYFPMGGAERRKYFPFHSASIKYKQVEYCFNKIYELSQPVLNKETCSGDFDFEVKIRTYFEGLIVGSRTTVDLALTGILRLEGIYPQLDSMSQLLNKIENHEKVKHMKLYVMAQEIKAELLRSEFTWMNSLFHIGKKSLRDQLVHDKYLRVNVTRDINEQIEITLDTGMKNRSLGYPVSVVKQILPFANEIKNGTEKIISKIREEAYTLLEKKESPH